ncbi:MAG: Ku protein [Candidatus Krumholzibacteria bacterium]|nr:Ku protein [Candidatus Krumholzibacteria bacterium]
MKTLRSLWKGHIRFSLVTIPIRIYNAVDTAQTVRFNQLHKECSGRVGYDKRCKKCNKVVSNEDIVKGYQYEPDQYVVFEKNDIDKVKLNSTKVIEIEGFVDAGEIHPTLYEAPYFAGPDGEVAAKTYALLGAALKDSGKMGIGKVVLRDREDIVAIAPHGGGLLLHRLRYPAEIKSMGDVPLIDDGIKTDKEELKLAKSLVDSMATSLGRIEMKDGYHGALREMIQAKIEGKEIVTVEEEDKPVVDIMTALKQSIEQAKTKKKPMVKATGKKTGQKAGRTSAKKVTKKASSKIKSKKRKTA